MPPPRKPTTYDLAPDPAGDAQAEIGRLMQVADLYDRIRGAAQAAAAADAARRADATKNVLDFGAAAASPWAAAAAVRDRKYYVGPQQEAGPGQDPWKALGGAAAAPWAAAARERGGTAQGGGVGSAGGGTENVLRLQQLQQMGGGAGLIGDVGQAMSGGGVAAGFQATVHAIDGTAKAIEVFGDSTKTAAQKADSFVKEFVPGGQALTHFRDAVMGTADALRRLEEQYQAQQLAQAQRHELQRTQLSGQAELQAAQAKAQALAGVQVPGMIGSDRGTFQGDIAHREAIQRQGAQFAVSRAEAQQQAAQKAFAAGAVNVTDLKKQLKDAEADAKAKQAAAGALGAAEGFNPISFTANPVGHLLFGWAARGVTQQPRDAAERAAELAHNNVTEQAKTLQIEINAQKERGVQLAEKESAVRKSIIEQAKTELSLAEAKEQRLTGQAQRWGGMTTVDRQMGLAAARALKAAGGDLSRFDPALIQQAEQFVPEYVRKLKEKFGQNTAEGKAAVAEGLGEAGDLGEARQQVEKVRADVNVKIALDEQTLATKIVEVLDRKFTDLIKAVKAEQAGQRAAQAEGVQRLHAAQH
jgi:hypothetical protein